MGFKFLEDQFENPFGWQPQYPSETNSIFIVTNARFIIKAREADLSYSLFNIPILDSVHLFERFAQNMSNLLIDDWDKRIVFIGSFPN